MLYISYFIHLISYFLFVILFCFSFTGFAQLKQKIVMSKSVGETEFSVILKEEYDKKGHLLLREQPKYYCTEQYQYDKEERLIVQDIMCGESNGNGITKYSYQKNKIVGVGEFGAYPFYVHEDSLDATGKKILHKRWQNLLDEDSAYVVENFFYTKTNKISKQIEYSKWFRKDGGNWKFDFDKKTEKTFSYTAVDSLEKVVFTDLLSSKSMIKSVVLEKNIYNKKQQLQEIIYAYESGESHKVFVYDKTGKITSMKMESRKTAKETWKLDSKTEFFYKDNLIIKEITTSYYNGSLNSTITNNYEKGILQTSRETDKNGKEVESIKYEYVYF